MNILEGYEWATHQPLIDVAMLEFKPAFVLELGPGIYSTPLFMLHNSELLCVENNKEWFDFIKEKYCPDIIFHDLNGILPEDRFRNLDYVQIREIGEFYLNLQLPDKKPGLLFIDQDPACRLISFNILRNKFDLIIVHDFDGNGFETNEYKMLNRDGFVTYFVSTEKTGAALMVRHSLDRGTEFMGNAVAPFIDWFCRKWDCKMIFNVYTGQPL